MDELFSDLELSDGEMHALTKSLKDYVTCYSRGWPINYPADFHPQLQELLENLMGVMGDELKRESGQPMLSRLVSMDWRVDL